MLGSLSLMACTLLLAAVPSLSSSLQPREEANLPAIGSVMYDDNYIGIQPLALGSSLTPSYSAMADSVTYHLGGLEVTLPTSTESVFSLEFDGDVLDEDEYFSSFDSLNYETVVYVSGSALHATDVDVYLPDLTYWTKVGDCYYIAVGYDLTAVDVYAYYANTHDGHGNFSYTLAELGADVNPVGAIGDGLGVIGALGGALSTGFDGVFLDNGVLTSVGTFSFVLLGLGISVGIVKKCFNWVTGRHGM